MGQVSDMEESFTRLDGLIETLPLIAEGLHATGDKRTSNALNQIAAVMAGRMKTFTIGGINCLTMKAEKERA